MSPEVYVPPGKVEAHTSGRLAYEIAYESIVKESFVDVWNDVEGTHYRVNIPTYIGYTRAKGDWFSLDCWHQYIANKRNFDIYLENWSHTWGRRFQLHLRYELGTRVKVAVDKNGSHVVQSSASV